MSDTQQTIFPHLLVNDAAGALEFYKKALGATEVMRMPAQDGKRLMHSEIKVGDARIFVMDDFPEHSEHSGRVKPPKQSGSASLVIHLEVPNCDQATERAEAAGATVLMKPWDAFWGARYAQVVDPFGHVWSFAHPLPGSPPR